MAKLGHGRLLEPHMDEMALHRPAMVVALGGNAVLREGQRGTVDEQLANCRESADIIAELARLDYDIAVVHGNGPEVGNIFLRSELARHTVPPSTLDICGAQSQGSLGYLIQLTLRNALHERGISRQVATVLTQTIVDPNDPAFQNPTKPIGPFYDAEEAAQIRIQYGWQMVEDAGRGYRRVVPSPKPADFVERETISRMIRRGDITICAGGGGVPVTRDERGYLRGIEAVIDKDRAAAVLARWLKADTLLIMTGVEKVCINFNTPQQRTLDRLTVGEAKKLFASGEFPAGSMGPKIQAAIDFLVDGGQRVIITLPEKVTDAVRGRAGTQITLE
jgi:carbamate kinase